MSEILRNGVEAGAKAVAKTLPGAAQGVSFNVLAPNIVTAIRELDTRVIGTLKEDVRETVRAFVEQGLREGVNPREVARNLRSIIGLSPSQAQAVASFRKALESRDLDALTRQLRDRRFDGTLRKAFAGDGLSPSQIDSMVGAYRRRFIGFHAETIARSGALDAQRLAQHLTFESAIARGDLSGEKVFKRWSTVRDDRVRPEHQLMEGETVRHDEFFSNGDMVVGESSWGCRCIGVYTTTNDPVTARKSGVGLPLGEVA